METGPGKAAPTVLKVASILATLAVIFVVINLELWLIWQSYHRTDWSWNPVAEPLAAVTILVPVVVIVLLWRLTRQHRMKRSASSAAQELQLRPELIAKIIEADDFESSFRNLPADQVPATAFLEHLANAATDGIRIGPTRMVLRATAFLLVSTVLVVLFVGLQNSIGPFMACLSVGGAGVPWWFARGNYQKAKYIDGAMALWKELGIPLPTFSDPDEVLLWMKRAVWAWATFPLAFWAMALLSMVAIGIGLPGGANLWTLIMLAPFGVSFGLQYLCDSRYRSLTVTDGSD